MTYSEIFWLCWEILATVAQIVYDYLNSRSKVNSQFQISPDKVHLFRGESKKELVAKIAQEIIDYIESHGG